MRVFTWVSSDGIEFRFGRPHIGPHERATLAAEVFAKDQTPETMRAARKAAFACILDAVRRVDKSATEDGLRDALDNSDIITFWGQVSATAWMGDEKQGGDAPGEA